MNKIFLRILILPLLISLNSFSQTAQMYLDSGTYYIGKKKYEESIRVLNKCIEIDKVEIEAYANRALAYYHLSQFDKCIADCNMALGIHEGYAELYNLRALCKDQTGNRESACSDWHQAYYYGFNDALRMIKKFCKDFIPPAE